MEEYNKRIINREALFCSATEDYRTPPEPDEDQDVLLRFRTGKNNAQHVYYVEDGAEVEIGKADSDELFDYYEYEITVGSDCVLYHFKVVNGQDSCIYNRLGVTDDDRSCFDFAIIPGFHTPGLGQGRGDVPDLCGPVLQRGREQRRSDLRVRVHRQTGEPGGGLGEESHHHGCGLLLRRRLKGRLGKLDYIQGLAWRLFT